ncbi:MAG: hypothetical protein ACM3XP_00430 [Nitrososphaerales archaeon]
MAKIAVILLYISLALLIIYGLDTFVASLKQPQLDGSPGTGFLPMNEAARGAIFGAGAVILSIIGFVIGRKEPSKAISILLLLNGFLIILGMIMVMAMNIVTPSEQSTRTIGSTMLLGGLLIGLGIAKMIVDKRKMQISKS